MTLERSRESSPPVNRCSFLKGAAAHGIVRPVAPHSKCLFDPQNLGRESRRGLLRRCLQGAYRLPVPPLGLGSGSALGAVLPGSEDVPSSFTWILSEPADWTIKAS